MRPYGPAGSLRRMRPPIEVREASAMQHVSTCRMLAVALFAAGVMVLAALTVTFVMYQRSVSAGGVGSPIVVSSIVRVGSVDADERCAFVTVVDPESPGGAASSFPAGRYGIVEFDSLSNHDPELPESGSEISLSWIGAIGEDDSFPLTAYDRAPVDARAARGA